MESKFKSGFYRLTQLSTAVVVLALMLTLPGGFSRVLLGLCALGLIVAVVCPRQVAALPSAVMPSLLALMLSLLLWLAPEQHAMWLWGWAAILALPQPALLLLVHILLAIACWWQVQQFAGVEQGLLVGLLLIALMLLGLARGLGLHTLWRGVSNQAFPMPGMPLRSAPQLVHDLPLETARCNREGSHGELLLVRSPTAHQQALASALAMLTRSYEGHYQIDAHTLGVLLISRDAGEAQQRRAALLEGLPAPHQTRFVMLTPALSLSSQLVSLAQQEHAVVMLEEPF